jgi:hypothetical protein
MRRALCILVLVLAVAAAGQSQQLLVFPAITDELPGLHGSLWVTNVRLVKEDWSDEVVVRRAWVCLEDGGFEDPPDDPPMWSMVDPFYERAIVLTGRDLLQGSGQAGAVGLLVEGGELIAHAYVADARYGAYHEPFPPGEWAFGQGQLEPAIVEPLVGPSHIPWLGGCLNNPCTQDPPELWDYLRNNIGLVNPNSEPLTVVGTVIPFGYWTDGFFGGGSIGELPQDPPETFRRTVPPYGWLQFRWEATTEHPQGGDWYVGPPSNGFIVSLTPDSDLPYYAYGSVVFTPDPESGGVQFNDPMFVPAEPGFVAPLGTAPGATEGRRSEPHNRE